MTYFVQQIWAAPFAASVQSGPSGFPFPDYSLKPTSDSFLCVVFSAIQVNKLKREMVHLQHELQFKERGFQTLKK